MKVKINLFKKIFLFSLFIIIFTIFLSYVLSISAADTFYISRKKSEIIKIKSYVLSISAADTFYISRKKSEIIKIKDTAVKYLRNEDIFEEYVENIRDKEGINIYIENRQNQNSHHRKRPRSRKEGINIYIENRQNQNSHHRKRPRSRYGNINEGFHVVSLPTNNIMLLVYKENISPVETLFVTTSLSVMGSHRQEVYMLNLITLVGAMLISMFISRIFAKKITDNIGALNRVAQKISHLDFSEKSEIKTSDELKDLSKSINIMAENISSSIEGLNTFVSNASHELKTPIAVINTHAQLLAAEKITEEAERKKYISSSIEGLNTFVSNASHELKTPIAVINTHAQLLAAEKITEEAERKKYVKVILNESRYMDTLVKDLLLMSKLSASEIKLNKEEFNLCEILKESIEQFEFLELQKDINWKIDCKNIKITGSASEIKLNKEEFNLCEILKESIEQFEFLELQKDINWKIDCKNIKITGNKKLIKIALNNIIQNSLKYSPENSNKKLIKIALNNIIQNSLKYSPENSEINIYEKDRKIFFENSMYIDEIFDTEKLFQPFYRGKNATEIKIEGSGLGLSLIKRIFDIHMIECGVKAENKKFIFWFDILR